MCQVLFSGRPLRWALCPWYVLQYPGDVAEWRGCWERAEGSSMQGLLAKLLGIIGISNNLFGLNEQILNISYAWDYPPFNCSISILVSSSKMEMPNRSRVLMDSHSLNRYIDLIPLRLQTTKIHQQSSVEIKYSHLVSSMKPIQLLISKYREKINSFIKELESKHRIKDISREIELYSERANTMEELEKELDMKVEREREVEDERKKRVKEIRDRLNSLKIENAQVAYEIEMEEVRLKELSKKQYQPVPRTRLVPAETQEEKRLRELDEEEEALEREFFDKIRQKIELNNLILEGFQQSRDSLKKSQKKCHQHGLVGSLIFKLTLPDKENKPHPQFKMGNDFKSLVYNTLKGKYKESQRKSKEQRIEIEPKRFLEFNQSQTIGILQLKPESFNILKYLLDCRTRDILLHYEQMK